MCDAPVRGRGVRILIVAFAIVLSGCSTTSQWKSTQLQQGLSENNVTTRIGHADSISLSGGVAGTERWTCKLYTYNNNGWGMNPLTICFSQSSNGTWSVNSWNVR